MRRLIVLVALASVTSLGFGSALVFAGSKAGTGQIGLRHVSVHGAAGRTAATITVCSSGGDYPTIQKAVDNAVSNDRIEVCAGTYTEQVVIPNTLSNVTLISTTPKGAVIKDTTGNPSQSKAIIEVAGATDITITGFTIEGPCSEPGGACIGYGVEVDNGGSATVDSNSILNIRDDPLTGKQNGWAIGTNTGGRVTATSNVIEGYQKAGIKLTGATSVPNMITDNTIVGAGNIGTIGQNGITISSGASATVSGNNISNNGFTGTSNYVAGIIAAYSPGDVTIENNTLSDNEVNIWVYDAGSANVTVSGNTADRGNIGIDVQASHGVQVVGNTTKDQANFGLLAAVEEGQAADTSGNTWNGNNASGVTGDGNYDCRDQSHGNETANTANTWTSNTGVTVKPVGICSPTPPPVETTTSTVTTTTTETVTEPSTTVTAPAQTITHPETVTLPGATVTTPGQTTVVTVPPGQTTTTVTHPAQTVTAPTETKTVVVTVTDPSHPVLLPPRIIVLTKVKTLVRTITRTLIRACQPAMGTGKG